MDLLCFCSVLNLLCLCARLFICALWSPAWKGLTSLLSFVVSTVSLSLSHWYPGSGVVLDCIDSWSLPPYLLLLYVMFSCVTVTLSYGILGQVWYMIVSIFDICILSFLFCILMGKRELVASLYLSSGCLMAVSVLWLFLTVQGVGL